MRPTHHHEEMKRSISENEIKVGSSGVAMDQRRAVIFGCPLEDSKVALMSISLSFAPGLMAAGECENEGSRAERA